MAASRERVESLLYEGESVEDAVEWAEGSVVLTSHRVLVFTPEMAGANFTQVDRPNVDGVRPDALSTGGLLARGLRYGVIGVMLIVTGTVVDFGSIIGDVDVGGGGAAGRIGIGGILGLLQSLVNLLTNLDQILQLFGALALLLAVALVGVHWLTRTPTMAIRVAGGDDIHVPRPDEATRTRLMELLPGEATTGAQAVVERLQ